MRKWRTTDDIP